MGFKYRPLNTILGPSSPTLQTQLQRSLPQKTIYGSVQAILLTMQTCEYQNWSPDWDRENNNNY